MYMQGTWLSFWEILSFIFLNQMKNWRLRELSHLTSLANSKTGTAKTHTSPSVPGSPLPHPSNGPRSPALSCVSKVGMAPGGKPLYSWAPVRAWPSASTPLTHEPGAWGHGLAPYSAHQQSGHLGPGDRTMHLPKSKNRPGTLGTLPGARFSGKVGNILFKVNFQVIFFFTFLLHNVRANDTNTEQQWINQISPFPVIQLSKTSSQRSQKWETVQNVLNSNYCCGVGGLASMSRVL